MKFAIRFMVLTSLLLGGGGQALSVDFSAEVVQSAPDKAPQISRLYMGEGRMRTEYEMNGQPIVQIVDTNQQTMIMLFPEQQAYMQQSAAAGGMPRPSGDTGPGADPCAGMPGMTCKKLATEDVNGRQAEKWEITQSQDDQDMKLLSWIDAEHRFPVRQIMPDGTIMELKNTGGDTIGGRATEKWEMTASSPDGKKIQASQWYDTQLGMVIREVHEGGFSREFRNVKVGSQPADLFSIPPGYKMMSMPAQGEEMPGDAR